MGNWLPGTGATEGNDEFYGDDANDVADGLGGRDTVSGLGGDDIMRGGADDDLVIGGNGNDSLFGGDGGDFLIGETGNDFIDGGDGPDRAYYRYLDLGLTSGVTVDLTLVADGANYILNAGLLGTDTLTAVEVIGIDATNFNDVLIGSALQDVLDGAIGSDRFITGDSEFDTIFGGRTGDEPSAIDTWVGALTTAADVTFDGDLSVEGYLIEATNTFLNGIERVELSTGTGFDNLRGTALDDILRGGAGNDTLIGMDGPDMLEGGAGHDILEGGAGSDTLDGGEGNDVLNGGAGNDTLIGGAGDDKAFYGYSDLGLASGVTLDLSGTVTGGETFVIEAGLQGRDTASGIEVIVVDGSELGDLLIGSALADELRSLGGSDTLDTGASLGDLVDGDHGDTIDTTGIDTWVARLTTTENVTFNGLLAGNGSEYVIAATNTTVRNIERYDLTTGSGNDSVYSNVLDDILRGGGGHDTLASFGGNDTLDGGEGDDFLVGGSGADTLIGGSGQDAAFYGGSPSDGLTTSLDGSLVATGDAVGDVYDGIESIYGASEAVNHLRGDGGGNTLVGGTANDLLEGLAGNDALYGGAGADQLVGGEGIDLALYGASTGVTVSLDGSLTATGDAAGDTFSSVESLWGSVTAADRLRGDGGANTLWGHGGHDTLEGGGGNDTIYGGDGNDRIVGGTGADALTGGVGNDTYEVDSQADVVTEASDGGNDTVLALNSYALAAGVSVEVLQLDASTGTKALKLAGNDLANMLVGNRGANVLDGGRGADRLVGGEGNDTYVVDTDKDVIVERPGGGIDLVRSTISLSLANVAEVENLELLGAANLKAAGNALANTLTGNGGANVLDGGRGTDRLVGGAGDDTYVVDSDRDVVVEGRNGGTDLVQALASYSLANVAEVENLTLVGSTKANATGNALANVLTGNGADNVLDGGRGNDTLIGGAGNDTYIVDSAADRIQESANRGTDLVFAQGSYKLANGVSVETLAVHSSADARAIDLTGNELANRLVGGAGVNKLSGGLGADTIEGKGGSDIIDLGADQVRDVVVLNSAAHSSSVQRDVLLNANLNTDKFDFAARPGEVLPTIKLGALNTASFDADIARAVDGVFTPGGAIQAVLFDPSAGNQNKAGHIYLVVDADNNGAYAAGKDYVIQLINPTGTLDITDFI